MKILYLTFNTPYISSGVHRRDSEFCEALYKICREKGIEFKGIDVFIDYVKSTKNRQLSKNCFELKSTNTVLDIAFRYIRILRPFIRAAVLLPLVYKEIKKQNSDIIIYRYPSLATFFPFNPKKINPKILFISEHHSKENKDAYLESYIGSIAPVIERIKASKFFKNVDAVVGVTTEIAKYELKRAKRGMPYFVLTNGIEVKDYPAKRFLEFKGDILKMIFIAGGITKWHGLDRLLRGMANYRGNVQLKLDIIVFV